MSDSASQYLDSPFEGVHPIIALNAPLAPQGEELKKSYFYVTMSTNYKPRGESDGDRDRDGHDLASNFAAAITQVMVPRTFREITDFMIPGDSWEENMRNIHTKSSVIEKGTGARGGRIHAHLLLEFTHTSRIRWRPAAVPRDPGSARAILNQKLLDELRSMGEHRVSGLWIRWKAFGREFSLEKIIEYIEKSYNPRVIRGRDAARPHQSVLYPLEGVRSDIRRRIRKDPIKFIEHRFK